MIKLLATTFSLLDLKIFNCILAILSLPFIMHLILFNNLSKSENHLVFLFVFC
jgi:hypothetical protein